jgi:hypothetical protein
MSPPTFRLEVEAGPVVGVNQAPVHRLAAWRVAEIWRDATFWLAKAERIPRMGTRTSGAHRPPARRDPR